MVITKERVIEKLTAYLHREIPLAALVDWAETGMMEEEFEETHLSAIRDAVARLGASDVREFGLTWEDCEELFQKLGCTARVEIVMQ